MNFVSNWNQINIIVVCSSYAIQVCFPRIKKNIVYRLDVDSGVTVALEASVNYTLHFVPILRQHFSKVILLLKSFSMKPDETENGV